MNHKFQVAVFSDNRLFRESLGRILTKRSDAEVTSCEEVTESSIKEAVLSGVNVVVLDSAHFLIANEVWLRAEIGARSPAKILLVAMEDNENLFLRAVRAGAVGFVPKDASAMDVVAAVRGVARGEAACPAHLCKFLFDHVRQSYQGTRNSPSRAARSLTRRERELIPLVDQGLTNKEIAARLHLSEKTIKNHMHHILRKAGVQSRLGLSEAYRNVESPQENTLGFLH